MHERVKEEYKDRTGKELSDDEFWIEVTGGDRFFKEIENGKEVAASATDKESVIKKSSKKNSHANRNGARGVDFKFSANIPKDLIIDILRNDPDIGHPDNVIDTYNDHVHFNLRPDNKENYLFYNDEKGKIISNSVGKKGWRDYEIEPDSGVFWDNKNGIPSYFNPNKPLPKGTKTFSPFNNKNKIDVLIETNKDNYQNIIDFFSTDNFIEKLNNEIFNLDNK